MTHLKYSILLIVIILTACTSQNNSLDGQKNILYHIDSFQSAEDIPKIKQFPIQSYAKINPKSFTQWRLIFEDKKNFDEFYSNCFEPTYALRDGDNLYLISIACQQIWHYSLQKKQTYALSPLGKARVQTYLSSLASTTH